MQNIHLVTKSLKSISGIPVMGVWLNEATLKFSTQAQILENKQPGIFSSAYSTGRFSAGTGETLFVSGVDAFPDGVLLVGLGEWKCWNTDNFILSLKKAVRALSFCEEIDFLVEDWLPGTLNKSEAVRLFASTTINALVPVKTLKTRDVKVPKTHTICWCSDKKSTAIQSALLDGEIIGKAQIQARELAELPSNLMTPSHFAQRVQESVEEIPGLVCTILGAKTIQSLGMGAFWAVAKGSKEEPRFIVLEYHGASDKTPFVSLIGKGVTFDSGGLSLKPAASMDEMKFDMCGAATVFSCVCAAARMGLKQNIMAVIPACENMPSGSATKPGDIVTSLSGLTIEIMNTDAEGRLLLADALSWAARKKPAVMIDVATLTGACVVALGDYASGLYSNDDALSEQLTTAGQLSADYAWPMPCGESYAAQMKSPYADLSNTSNTRAGSASAAAAFLRAFTGDISWAHLDVAGTANTCGAGRMATGRPIGLLMQYLLMRESSQKNGSKRLVKTGKSTS